ncbi:hypothetical protein BH24ACI5_BH24ACI5_15120 [soil metagenome]
MLPNAAWQARICGHTPAVYSLTLNSQEIL